MAVMQRAFRLFHAIRKSPLPKDSRVFEGNLRAVAVRYRSHRIVRWWTGRGYSRTVNVAVQRAGHLAPALHLLAYWSIAHDAVGVEFYPDRLGVEVFEIDLTSNKCCSPRVSTFISPRRTVAHCSSRLCSQSTICLPIAPLLAIRKR